MRITVGISCFADFKAPMAVSLLKGLSDFPFELHLSVVRSPYLDSNREAIIQEALKAESEKVLFIDTDMEFPPDAMRRICSHTKAIIGGAYNEKKLPPTSTVRLDDGKGGYLVGKASLPNKPFMCAAVATGFLALHLPTVTKRMQPPYMEYERDSRGRMGEDLFFCRKARAAGLEIWCDPTIPLRHIGDFAY